MVSPLHVISSQVAVQALITRTSLGRFNPCLIFIENASWNQVVCHAKIINESSIYDSEILSFQQLYTSFSFCMNLPQTGSVDWTSIKLMHLTLKDWQSELVPPPDFPLLKIYYGVLPQLLFPSLQRFLFPSLNLLEILVA